MRWIVPLLIAIAPIQAVQAAASQSPDPMSYAIFMSNGGSTSTNMSSDDYRRAERYRTGKAPLLYVRDGGAAYVIRDAAMLRWAEAIMAPQQELGRRQGVLGAAQGELGRQQGILGKEQGRLGAQMLDSTPRQMAELGRKQGELGRQQGVLGKQQGELGRQQGALGKLQGRAAQRAKPKFRALVAEAKKRGVAQRVN